MARRRQTTPVAEPRIGRVARLVHDLACLPRLSSHQELAWRLAELALDLPAAHEYPLRSSSSSRIREKDRLASGALIAWCLEVFHSNPLAGLVVMDSMDYVSRSLAPFLGHHDIFPSQHDKRWLTEGMSRHSSPTLHQRLVRDTL